MRRLAISTLLLLALACSDNPASPEPDWTAGDLHGLWSGQLADFTFLPDSTVEFMEVPRNDPAFYRRFDLRDLDVTVNISDHKFLIKLYYFSDSLFFLYTESGNWELEGDKQKVLRMDSTEVYGRIEDLQRSAFWTSELCCWRADIELASGDPGTSGFSSGILRLLNIQSRIGIHNLSLEK